MNNSSMDLLFDGEGAPEATALENAADRDAILLTALLESSDSPEDFVNFVEENVSTMEVYGILSPEVATEASVKKIKVVMNKQSQMSRAEKLAAFTLARQEGSENYKKYLLFKTKMREQAAIIFKKFGSRGKKIARQQLNGAYHAAKRVPGKAGAQMTERIDRAINATKKDGTNGSAIKKKK